MSSISRRIGAVAVSVTLGLFSSGIAQAEPGHSGPQAGSKATSLEQLREEHRKHEHPHDFKAMEAMTPEQGERLVDLMRDIGLALPPMDSHRGQQIYMDRGCVVCHAINGVGGEVGPALDAADMPSTMNAFDFAARMWKGAAAMVAMQEEELGDIIKLSGQDLADLVAFVHDRKLQKNLSIDQVPKRWRKKLAAQ